MASVHTIDGRVLTATVAHPRGSTERPLSDADIEMKVRDLARHGGFQGSIDDMIGAIWRLDTMATIDPLLWPPRGGQYTSPAEVHPVPPERN